MSLFYLLNFQTSTLNQNFLRPYDYEQIIAEKEARIRELEYELNDLKENKTSRSKSSEIEDLITKVHSRWRNGSLSGGGLKFHNEFEMSAFARFTLNRIYLIEPGLGKRVVEKPIAFKKKDILEVVSGAYPLSIQEFYQGKEKSLYTDKIFLEGIVKNEPSIGAVYELYFRNLEFPTDRNKFVRVTLSRPFAPVYGLGYAPININNKLLLVILPLSYERLDKFKSFLDRFQMLALEDTKLAFTLVYFGEKGSLEAKSMLNKLRQNQITAKFIHLKETFSRGRGLQAGVDDWQNEDVILFFCDVDVIFNAEFLQRCRLNVEKGKRVYYPMVFSLYNPKVVYTMHGYHIPKEDKQLVISKDTGFWRDFGYGMTCQYKSDFESIRGFDQKVSGWGKEDVLLFKKYVKSSYVVLRSPDQGIFHLWHPKECDGNLPIDQYRSCLSSRALNEASHRQLGMLAFKDEIKVREKLKENSKS
ncbi:DgyrCDS2186 [Dimorphilus gyrociliatus]|uniref:Hexosyltransferase n=1 Tax=Dimorphilus gyrociliatus TaxID=2664684 RepID=A0A7I8VCJ9_9ANNE|nr:DgyrCDS2186 [Dimorphilus gyrociliatus]